MSGTGRRFFSLCDYIVDTATQQTLDCIFATVVMMSSITLFHYMAVQITVVLRYGANGSYVKQHYQMKTHRLSCSYRIDICSMVEQVSRHTVTVHAHHALSGCLSCYALPTVDCS